MYNKLEMLIEYAKIIDNLIKLDGDQFSDGNVIDMISTINNSIINDGQSLVGAVQKVCTMNEIDINDIVDKVFLHRGVRRYETPLTFFKYGDIFTMEEREDRVNSGGFVSSDGSGNWIKDGKVALEGPFETTKEDADGVIRFNK